MKIGIIGAGAVGGTLGKAWAAAGQRPSMFICGDDAAAKRTVGGLAEALGFEPVDAGPLTWISMAYADGQGTNTGFRRTPVP